jgi:hypothetical protein
MPNQIKQVTRYLFAKVAIRHFQALKKNWFATLILIFPAPKGKSYSVRLSFHAHLKFNNRETHLDKSS